MVSIIDKTIVDDLSDKANWRLCSILIKERHVEIIHEIDESLAWWWTESSTGSLVYLGFNNNLKRFRISVVIKVNGCVKGNIFVEGSEVILNDSGFTSTSGTNVKHASSMFDMKIKKESLSGSFSSWNNQVLEKTFIAAIKFCSLLIPMSPLGCQWIEEEIKALTMIWELNLCHSFPRVREGKLIFIKRSTISPHTSENEECFIDLFDFIIF